MPLPQANKARALILDKLTPVIIVLVFGGVVVPAFLYLIQPRIQVYLPGGLKNVKAQTEILKGREEYLNDLRAFARLYKEKGLAADADIRTLVPEGGETDFLFAFYETLGARVNASLQVIDIEKTPTTKKAKPDIANITVAVKYAGVDYAGLKELLRLLETSKRLADVLSFSFDPVGKFASMTVKLYYLPLGPIHK